MNSRHFRWQVERSRHTGRISATAVISTEAHAAACECRPDSVLMSPTKVDHVRHQYAISGIKERWVGGLQLQAIHDKLQGDIVAAASVDEIWVKSVTGCRVSFTVRFTVPVDQQPVHIPQCGRPQFSIIMRKTVDQPDIKVVERQRIDRHIETVWE